MNPPLHGRATRVIVCPMKTRQTVITPEGDKATVTEIHRNGKTVKVEMWGRYVNGIYTSPARPFIRVYKPSQLKVVSR